MFKPFASAVIACFFATTAWAQAEPAAASAERQPDVQVAPPGESGQDAAPETVLVVGQRPGPGLWKISKGGRVLWVFGTYAPLPKKMEWRSQQVETILAQSQEYLLSPSASLSAFKVLYALPFAVGVDKNPDNATLKDVLPHAAYARWLVLKDKYGIKDDSVERRRPIFAAERLLSTGLASAGLGGSSEVSDAIYKIARKNNVKVTSSNVKVEIDSPVRAIRDFKKSSLDDVACFTKTMDRLETDIDAMRVRANAWAKGDLDAIRKLDYVGREEACHSAIMNSAMMKGQGGIQTMEARMNEAWLASAQKSLATNASTFAILPIKSILDPKGVIAQMQAMGYLVEAPE